MIRKILHTPEGVRDVYGEECERKSFLEEKLRAVSRAYGYRNIEPPVLEYFDVFGSEIGTIPSRELYKFFDREGDTLVLRPDFTPSIARAAERFLFKGGRPVRVGYVGKTFQNHSSHQGRLNEVTQLGAELIGDGSVDADAESIAMAFDMLEASGLPEFQISIGHVQFFESLAEEAGLNDAARQELRMLLENRNTFGAGRLLGSLEIPEEVRAMFLQLPTLFGGEDMLRRARALAEGHESARAVDRLLEISELLEIYGAEDHVTYDLSMLPNYRYYTGVLFRGYTYGTGDAVVKGGRYDTLLGHFGTDAPAVGYAVVIDEVLNALTRQKKEILPGSTRLLVIYHEKDREEALRIAVRERREGREAVLRLISDEADPLDEKEEMLASGCGRVIRVQGHPEENR